MAADLNPYRPPAEQAEDSAPSDFCVVDTTKLTFEECRNIARSSMELGLLLLFKTLRIRLQNVFAFSSRLLPLDPAAITPQIQAALGPLEGDAVRLGGKYLFTYGVELIGRGEMVVKAYQPADGQSLWLLTCARFVQAVAVVTNMRRTVVTELTDHTIVATSGERPDLLPPPYSDNRHFPGATLDELVHAHRDRLAQLSTPISPWNSPEECFQFLQTDQRRDHEHWRARGVLKRLTEDRVQRLLRQGRMPPPTARPVPSAIAWWSLIGWSLLAGALIYLVDLSNPRWDLTCVMVCLTAAGFLLIAVLLHRKIGVRR